LKNKLKAVEGKSAGMAASEPVHFAVISGQRIINEKIEQMLRSARNEVLWIAPKLEVKRAIVYDRDRMLRECARRNVTVRIITEIDATNVDDVDKISRLGEIRHSAGVTSLATIVDGKEVIIGSAVHSSESLTNGGLMNELWTNDAAHVSIMKDFFRKVWNISMPAKLEIASIRSGKTLQPITILQGAKNVKKQILDSLTGVRSRLFMVSRVDDPAISLIASKLQALQKRKVSARLAAVVDKQKIETAQKLAKNIKVRFLSERPVSFIVTDSDCLFSSSPILQIPHEAVWSIDQNTVDLFWALAEDIWTNLAEDTADIH
jgi:sugar-specific transcriptional regulator TrmB